MSDRAMPEQKQQTPPGQDLGQTTLGELLERAIPYERWRAPFDRRLRVFAWIAGTVLGLNLVFLMALPHLIEVSRSDFFMALGGTLEGLFVWLEERAPILIGINVIGLGIYLALLWRTRGLETGTLAWQRVAFGEVIGGAVGSIPLTVSLGIAVFNVGLWIVAIVIGIVLGILGAIAMLGLMGFLIGAMLEG